jgi:hypothetical protein
MKTKSIKLDKSINDWVLAIYCNYGKPDVKRLLRASYSLESGEKAWTKFCKSWKKSGYRLWQENKQGKIVRDSHGSI